MTPLPRHVGRTLLLVFGLGASVASAGPPPTPTPALKLNEGAPRLPLEGPVVYRCPKVNITFQIAPTGANAAGWNGHAEAKTNVSASVTWRTPNPGVEYDTILCVYNFRNEGKTIQDHRVTVVGRNAPPDKPICETITDLDHIGFKCRPLKPNEKYK